ncbi:MAG: SCP2 sterol-binding domain-containing protein [Thermoplasmata archaeon]
MAAFPSAEWAALFRTALNDNPVYAQAAAAWEGDILFEVLADGQAAKGPGIDLDLSRGQCREARFVADASTLSPEFVFRATRENWQRIMRREVDPVKAFLGGTIKMSGNPAKIMRFIGAAKELIDTAAGIPRDS